MTAKQIIEKAAIAAVKELWSAEISEGTLQITATRKEFKGDLTIVVFALAKISHAAPAATAEALGAAIKSSCPQVEDYNVANGGFLNISFSQDYWANVFEEMYSTENWGQLPSTGKTIMVEFSSPNTNKPLHLGHVRNNLLGQSVSQLLAACGHKVIKVNLVNDRGIHICKSMLAWKKTAGGATPATSGIKGDHLVGDCYVAFNNLYSREVKQLVEQGLDEEEAKKQAPSLLEAQDMLLKWEQGDSEVRELWNMMNSWVYEGFAKTYSDLGISFDKTYYESNTYLLGKALVQKGLDMGVFYRKEDGSVWCNLEGDGLDQKLLLRSDGTSVYMTQDLGTAESRFNEYDLDEHIYVVGNEQNYHFQVLKLILGKLGFSWSDAIYHLSYGMVELPEGKMKSREGTVVDADDLIASMYEDAKTVSEESGKTADLNETEKDELYKMVSLGALKYFIIKVDPKKTMLFNPAESIDFNGNTGPFIQYTHARICSILRKAGEVKACGDSERTATEEPSCGAVVLLDKEVELVKILAGLPAKIEEAGLAHSPALVANYAYELAKEFNQYYHETPVLKEENPAALAFRLRLIDQIARSLRFTMGILGITLPERM